MSSIPEKPHTEGQTFTNPETGVEYVYDGVKWLTSGGDELDLDLSNYVKKTGGDSMQGPLQIQTQGGDARATNKVNTLGVFSNSEGSALRLGTTRDRVYIGHNDTSFNGPLKVEELQEKTVGNGIKVTDKTIFEQPEGTNQEGFSVLGKTDEGENKKLLSVYHNAVGVDAVNYYGKQEGDTNLATIGHVQNQIDSLQQKIEELKAEIEAERFSTILHDSPFVSKSNNAQLYYSSNAATLPANERLFGTFWNGNAMQTNRFPANWNSQLRVGNGIIAIDRNGSKIDIPLGYDEDWTGTVSIYEFNTSVISDTTKLSLVFKNSVHNIRRSAGNNVVYITFGTDKNGYDRHAPIFARGDVQGDLAGKNVIMLLDVYRIGDRHDPEGGGVSFDAVDQTAITEPIVPE